MSNYQRLAKKLKKLNQQFTEENKYHKELKSFLKNHIEEIVKRKINRYYEEIPFKLWRNTKICPDIIATTEDLELIVIEAKISFTGKVNWTISELTNQLYRSHRFFRDYYEITPILYGAYSNKGENKRDKMSIIKEKKKLSLTHRIDGDINMEIIEVE